MISLNSNLDSQRAQRTLDANSCRLEVCQERLASGQRINRASDDAAGLAIADSLCAESRLYSAALRNINDGISTVNIIDSALSQQANILQRLIELAQESANGTFSTDQRGALSSEYRALVKEFGRIAQSTSYNKQILLQRSRDPLRGDIILQAGIDGTKDSQLAIQGADTGEFTGSLDIESAYHSGIGNLVDFARFKSLSSNNLEQLSTRFPSMAPLDVMDSQGRERTAYLVPVEYDTETNELLLFFWTTNPATNEPEWSCSSETYSKAYSVPIDPVTGAALLPDAHLKFTAVLLIAGSSTETGATIDCAVDLSGLKVLSQNGDTSCPNAINFSGIETSSRSLRALTICKNRLAELAAVQGEYGAIISRLQTAARNIGSTCENALSAESRIRDTDMAAEAGAYIKAYVMQGAIQAVLAQANIQPRLALQLI